MNFEENRPLRLLGATLGSANFMGRILSTDYPQLIPTDIHRKPQNSAIFCLFELDPAGGLRDYICASDGLRTGTCGAGREVRKSPGE